MEALEIHQALVDLAREAGLELRVMSGGRGGEGEPLAESGVCRLRDKVIVVLSGSDSVEERISVLVSALQTFAPEILQGRYLAPLIRSRLFPDEDPEDV